MPADMRDLDHLKIYGEGAMLDKTHLHVEEPDAHAQLGDMARLPCPGPTTWPDWARYDANPHVHNTVWPYLREFVAWLGQQRENIPVHSETQIARAILLAFRLGFCAAVDSIHQQIVATDPEELRSHAREILERED